MNADTPNEAFLLQEQLMRKEIARLREENECFEAMKQGVSTKIADLEAEIKRLRELVEAGKEDRDENKRLLDDKLHNYILQLIYNGDYETIYEHGLNLEYEIRKAMCDSGSVVGAENLHEVKNKLQQLDQSTQYLFEHDMITTIPETGHLTITDYGFQQLR